MNYFESELKLVLDENEYNIIRNNLIPINNPILQVNYYFDSINNIFSKNRTTFRIRNENDSYEICVKVKKSKETETIVSSEEFLKEIKKDQFTEIIQSPEKIFNYIDEQTKKYLEAILEDNPIKLLGSIQNTRIQLRGILDYIFELDFTVYPNDMIRYELEIERFDIVHIESLYTYLNNIGIATNLSIKGKYETFVSTLNKQN